MINVDELEKLYEEYLNTLDDTANIESYGTVSDFAGWWIPDFVNI